MSQKKPEKPEKERIRRFGEAKDSRGRGFKGSSGERQKTEDRGQEAGDRRGLEG